MHEIPGEEPGTARGAVQKQNRLTRRVSALSDMQVTPGQRLTARLHGYRFIDRRDARRCGYRSQGAGAPKAP